MNDFEWQVKILPEPWNFKDKVFIFRRTPNGTEQLKFTNKGQVIEKLKEGIDAEPSFEMGTELLRKLIQAAEDLKGKSEVPAQSFLAGELASTKYHLEDMRKLVFEPPRIE